MSNKNNVVPFSGVTTLDLDPDQCLEGMKGICSEIIVVGFDNDTGLLSVASSEADIRHATWLLQKALQEMLLRSTE